MTVLLNPECQADKHWNCDGTSWDNDLDTRVACPCICHEPAAARDRQSSNVSVSNGASPRAISTATSTSSASAVPTSPSALHRVMARPSHRIAFTLSSPPDLICLNARTNDLTVARSFLCAAISNRSNAIAGASCLSRAGVPLDPGSDRTCHANVCASASAAYVPSASTARAAAASTASRCAALLCSQKPTSTPTKPTTAPAREARSCGTNTTQNASMPRTVPTSLAVVCSPLGVAA